LLLFAFSFVLILCCADLMLATLPPVQLKIDVK